MLAGNGVLNTPSYAFSGYTGVGMFMDGSARLGFAYNNTEQMYLDGSGVTIPTLNATTASFTSLSATNFSPNRVLAGNGVLNTPSYAFSGYTGVGMFMDGSARLGFAYNNTEQMYLDGSGVTIPNLIIASNITPTSDAVINLGSGSNRWNTVYAANGTINTSDITLKKNISTLNYGLDAVMNITPITFNWKDERLGTQTKIGFSAQELQKIVPEVVQNNGNSLGVYYADLIPVAFNAIKEQQSVITGISSDQFSIFDEFSNIALQEDQNIATLIQTTSSVEEVKNDIANARKNILALQEDANAQSQLIADIKQNMALQEMEQSAIRALVEVHQETIIAINENFLFTKNGEDISMVTIAGILVTEKLKVKEIETNKLMINDHVRDDQESDAASIGTATIPAGKKEIMIETKAITRGSRVFVSPKMPLDQTLAATKIVDGKSFVVELLTERNEDLDIDWFIIGEVL